MNSSRSSVAILFVTHFIDATVIAEYLKLKREAPPDHDVILLYNTTERLPGEPPAEALVFRFDERDLRRLRYPAKKTHVSSFNVELFVVNFWLRNPRYRQYWMVEYDMRFSGDWGLLFGHFASDPADLLSTTVYRFPTYPEWDNWASLRLPRGITLAPHQKIAAYMPLFRISNAGLAAVHAGYLAGWAGHSECTVPTLVALAGLTVEDIGGDGEFVRPDNVNRFYRNTPRSSTHGPGTLVFRPVRTAAGDEPNMLWHPVKCAEGMATSRRQKVVRRAKIMLRSGLGAVGLH